MTQTVTEKLESLIDSVSETGEYAELKSTLQAAVAELEQRQLLIDEMVIYYCPENMSDKQFEHWRKNSQPAKFGYYH